MLSAPKEPLEIKQQIKRIRETLGDGKNISEFIDRDIASVEIMSTLPRYLWEFWEETLKEKGGITWYTFLRVFELHLVDFIEWALYERKSWNESVNNLIKTIENYFNAK